MKFLKINKQLSAIEDLIVDDYVNLVFQFTKICLGVFVITHWAACLFFTVGSYEFMNIGESWINIQGI